MAGLIVTSPIEPHLGGPVEVGRCCHTRIRHLGEHPIVCIVSRHDHVLQYNIYRNTAPYDGTPMLPYIRSATLYRRADTGA